MATIRSPQSLLLAEQAQLFHPFCTGEVFHPSDHFCSPPLDLLQQVLVFLVLKTPELHPVSKWGLTRAEGQNYLKLILRSKCLFLLCVCATSAVMGPFCTVDANASEPVAPAPEENVPVLEATGELRPLT